MMGLAGFAVSLVAGGFHAHRPYPFPGMVKLDNDAAIIHRWGSFDGVGLVRSRSRIAVAGLIISIVVFFVATARLIVGCGVI